MVKTIEVNLGKQVTGTATNRPSKTRIAAVLLIIVTMLMVSLPSTRAAGIRVGPNIDIRGETGADRQVVETAAAVDPMNPQIVVAGAGDERLNGLTPWDGYYRSTDGGVTWSSRLLPGFPGDTSPEGLASPLRQFKANIDPSLAFDRQGNLYFAGAGGGLTASNTPAGPFGVFVAKFTNDGADYAGAVMVLLSSTVTPDFPKIAVDITGGVNDGNVYLSMSEHGGTETWFTRSTDGGLSFSEPIRVSATGNEDVAVDSAGNVFVETAECSNGASHCLLKPTPVLVAKSTDGGLTFSRPVVAAVVTVTPFIFPGNSFTLVGPTTSIAADAKGIYMVSDDYSAGNSNIVFSRSTDGGQNWSPTIRLNDVINGEHFLPNIAVSGGIISVVWYDSRLGQSSNGTITGLDVYYAQSKDAGVSFSQNVRVTSVSFNPNLVFFQLFQSPFIGDYVGIAASPGMVHPVWTDNRNVCDTLDPRLGCIDQDVFTATIIPLDQ